MNTEITSIQMAEVFAQWLESEFHSYSISNNDVEITSVSMHNINNVTKYLLINYVRKSNREQLFMLKISHALKLCLNRIERYNPKYMKELTQVLTHTFGLTGLDICEHVENAKVIGEA